MNRLKSFSTGNVPNVIRPILTPAVGHSGHRYPTVSCTERFCSRLFSGTCSQRTWKLSASFTRTSTCATPLHRSAAIIHSRHVTTWQPSRKYPLPSLATLCPGTMCTSVPHLLPAPKKLSLSIYSSECTGMQHLHSSTSGATSSASASSEPLSRNCVTPSTTAEQHQQHHPRGVHHGSTSGMSGVRTPTPSEVFSEENKLRVMTNLSKMTLRRFYTKDEKKRGAVLVPLCSVHQEPCVLFTLRSMNLTSHSGEVSFPGGKMDSTDRDVCHTALREMEEELGIDASIVEIWGNLSPVGREDIVVVPVIGFLGELDIDQIQFNHDEVAAVFVMTLSQLCSPENQAYTVFEPHWASSSPMATLPVFVGGEHRIWGLTAFILDRALQAIVPTHYESLLAKIKRAS